MSTELMTARSTALAKPGETSPWREAANEEVGANFGTLLKFVKGDWLVGEEQNKIGPTTTLVVNMDEYWRGWIKWEDSQPVNHVIGRVVDRFRVPGRDELGDLDQSQWENDGSGLKRDPWQRVTYLVMRNAENDEIITFSATSDGGRKAAGKLADRYDRLRHKYKAKMPVVALKGDTYYNKRHHTDVAYPISRLSAGISGMRTPRAIPRAPCGHRTMPRCQT